VKTLLKFGLAALLLRALAAPAAITVTNIAQGMATTACSSNPMAACGHGIQ